MKTRTSKRKPRGRPRIWYVTCVCDNKRAAQRLVRTRLATYDLSRLFVFSL